MPLSTFIETSLREHSAIAARFKASWRRLALLPMLPFVAGESGLSLTWRGVLVGIETMGAGGGGVAGRGGDVAGVTVGGGWVREGDGSAAGVESSFFLLLVRLFAWKTMFVSDCIRLVVAMVVMICDGLQ